MAYYSLAHILLFAIISSCFGSFFSYFEDGLKKQSSLRNTQFFAIKHGQAEVARENKISADIERLFEVNNDQVLFVDVLRSFGYHQSKAKYSPAWLKSFKVTNCSEEEGKQSTFVIRSLEVSPDPLALPGIVTVHFEINNLLDISDSADVQISVDMYLTRGGTTVKLPCEGVFGSCTYNDVCSLLAPIQICPPEFMESNVPCKCPINKADYILQQISADVGISFPPGDYSTTANMTLNGGTSSDRRKRMVSPVRGKVGVHILITSGQVVGTACDLQPAYC